MKAVTERQPNRTIGRDLERAEILALLATESCRLITITGPGGIGKTRVALDVAAESDRDVAFAVFADVQDPDLFLPGVATALGIATRIGGDVRLEIEQSLRPRCALLVVDNLEHLTGVGQAISWLMGLDVDLRVLATSRSPLNVRGEHDFALEPLDSASAGVELFIERAQQGKRSFEVDETTRMTIGRICERLDGLPLAIELAAARMKVVSPAMLESMLDSRLALLTGGEQDRPDRHRTMSNAIAWSFDLLNPSQQDLFVRISLFEGGFSLLEATELTDDSGDPAAAFRTLDGLTGLIDASLLRSDESGDEPRFRMLETVRAFGQERLQGRMDSAEIQTRHAVYFLDLVEASVPALRGAERTLWLERLGYAHANLRAGLSWLMRSNQTELALRMAGALWPFWWWRSHVIEGRKFLLAVTAAAAAVDFPALLARCLTGMGSLTETMGRYAEAEEFHKRADQLLGDAEDTRGLAESCLFRWLVSFNAEDQGGMSKWSSQSLALFRDLDDQWGVAMSLMEQGVMAMRGREHHEATTVLNESRRLFESLADPWGVAICQGVQSNVETDRKDYARAHELQRSSLNALLSLNDLWGVATVLPAAARLAAEMGQVEIGVRLSGATAALGLELGTPMKVPFRERFESTLSQARGMLGSERFERAWSEGSALGPDEAVALAGSIQVGSNRSDIESAAPAVALSPREREVLRLVPTNSARVIGEQLFISESTVRTHIDNILNKFGARNQKELIAMIYERRLV